MNILMRQSVNILVSNTRTYIVYTKLLYILATFYTQDFSLVQLANGSVSLQCAYAIGTDDTVQCVVVFTDIYTGQFWNTTIGRTPGTHPPMGSKVIIAPPAGVYNITVYDSIGDTIVLAIVHSDTVDIGETVSTITTDTISSE